MRTTARRILAAVGVTQGHHLRLTVKGADRYDLPGMQEMRLLGDQLGQRGLLAPNLRLGLLLLLPLFQILL